jgi:hypothetical protein
MTQDRYSGDPRIILTPNGANLDYEGGQPIMDQGLENQAIISLFTRPGWVGNLLLDPQYQIGSDFEASVLGQGLTLAGLALIQNAAVIALTSPAFPELAVTATNPVSDRIKLTVTAGPGQAPLSFLRAGQNWQAQAVNPASGRLVATS